MSNERVVCAACGSNNFATQAACWKCSKPLIATPAPVAAVPVARYDAPHGAAAESPAAFWSSMALGVIFPVISIPVGLVFLMLDDKRKSKIGWWNILFGLIGTVLNVIVVAVSLAPLRMGASRMLPSLTGLGGRGGAQSQDMSSEAPPLDIPGQRPFANPPR